MPVSLYEDFDNPSGEFLDYDTYDVNQLIALGGQEHVDIRSFEKAVFTGDPMYFLDASAGMSYLDALTMGDLEDNFKVSPGENWTAGTIGAQSDRHNHHGLSLTCTTGTNTTSSVMDNDLAVNLLGSDYISLALPAFPLASLTLASTFIDFTTNLAGDFTAGPTTSLAFSTSTTTLLAGDSQVTFPMSALAGLNWSAITGVRFRIQATAGCTFRCLSIRGITNSWEYAPVDQNTLYDRLEATVPPDGSVGGTYAFPSSGLTPSDWPILFFADPIEVDPTPVDIQLGVKIHTGTGAALNTFELYLRESPLLPNQQLDLNGQTMAQLEALGEQPDAINTSDEFTAILMYQLDGQLFSVLDLDSMGKLEATNVVHTRYILVTLEWGTSNLVSVQDATGAGYTFTISPALSPLSDYYLSVVLIDSSIRVQIHPLTVQGYIEWDTVTFDSTAIIDGSFVYRRQGRFGWYAHLGDGDSYIEKLRPSYIVHNEYRSLPLMTETPTEGAQIFVGATPERDLYTGMTATDGATIAANVTRSNSGQCFQVTCDGNLTLEGLQSNAIRFENLYETYVSFDLLAPPGLELEAFLIGEFRYVTLETRLIQNNNWQHIEIPLDQIGALNQPGVYTFALVQTSPTQNVWYIDNLHIFTRSVSWAGRQAADPWSMRDPDWIPFNTTINKSYDGILFDRGNQMQIRGRGLTQDATIDSIKILPKYAQLGNFVWDDQAPVSEGPPVPSFTLVGSMGTGFSFDARASTAPNGIAAYAWSFGDGASGYGPQIAYNYLDVGNYTVTLTVIDLFGLKASVSKHLTGGRLSLPLLFTQ